MEKLYEIVRTGFENLVSLAEDQILLLTLIGSILQKFALVELHPLPYSLEYVGPQDSASSEREYGLAPHDMKFGDILIPFDETELRYFAVDESFLKNSDMADAWKIMQGFAIQHLVEVSICLRPISPKLVYEVSDVSQDGLPLPLDEIAALNDGSRRTYRDRQND